MQNANRGEVWIVDLGMTGKIRPCLILSVPPGDEDRVLVTLVPHTTSIQKTRFEIPLRVRFLKGDGVFDCQQVLTVAHARLVRRIGRLSNEQLAHVEQGVRNWLGL